MSSANALSAHLGKLESSLAVESATDAELVERFLRNRDDVVFRALMRRHGPMVWGVCRRILQDQHDAEDAFQATFFILAKKADSIAPKSMVGNWLYGVAVRAAQKARTDRTRRDAKERRAAEMRPAQSSDAMPTDDLKLVLDQALSMLPDKYRVPIVLCDLEGRTRDEAARELGWPPGSVAGRLARGRELLARRLTRRGIVVSTATLAATLADQCAAQALPPQLLVTTPQLAAALTPQIASLVNGVLHAMFVSNIKIKLAIGFVVLCFGLGTGGVAVALTRDADEPTKQPIQSKSGQAIAQKDKPEVKMTDAEKLKGTWDFATLEVDGNPVPPASLNGSNIAIDGDRFTSNSGGIIYKGTFQIDATKLPKTLDLNFTEGPEKGNTNRGIYELDGETWKICLDMTGKGRPTEFATKPGSGHALETLKRRKPDPKDEQIKKDLAFLEGEWSMTAGEMDGQVFQKEQLAMMKRVAVDGETTVTVAGQRFIRAKYIIDPSQKPKFIDYILTDGPDLGKKQLGIYEIDGDTVRFCFAKPGADRPTDFTAGAGSGRTVSAWKRDKK